MNIRKTKGFVKQQDTQINLNDTTMEKFGCYFLSLLSFSVYPLYATQYNYDLINRFHNFAIENGYMRKDMYVLDPVKLYNMIADFTGKTMVTSVNKHTPEYRKKVNEIEIQLWSYMPAEAHIERQHHFVAIHKDGLGKIMYDPYGKSKCVQLGNPISLRILTLKQ